MPANVDISDDPLIQQSTSSMETMETEAAEFFAARTAAQNQGDAGLNPVAPALEKAAEKAAAAKAPVAKAAEKPASTTKVPGAPTSLKKVEPATEPSTGDASKAAPAEPDLSDTPRTFRPGLKAHNWDKLHLAIDHHKSAAATAAAERDALRAELEAAKASITTAPEVQQRLTTLQQERDALRSQLEAVAGERIFDTEAKPRRDAALAQAKAAVGLSEAAKIDAILALPESAHRDNALEELLATLPPLRATKLASAVAALDQLTAERNAAAAQGGEIWNRRMAAAQDQQAKLNAERIAKASSTFDAELKEWEPVGLSAEDIANARSVYSGQGATLQDASRAALWAVAGPKAAQMAQDLQTRVAELEGELAKLRGAQPGVGAAASGALPTSGGDDDFDPTMSYAEAMAKSALKGGVRFTPSV